MHNPVSTLKATGRGKAQNSYLNKAALVKISLEGVSPPPLETVLQEARTHKPQKVQSLPIGAETAQAEAGCSSCKKAPWELLLWQFASPC